MKLVPLSDRVVLKQIEAEETTASGIILTSQAKEKPQQAEVIAVGPGGIVDGEKGRHRSQARRGRIYCSTSERYSGSCRGGLNHGKRY